MKNTKQKRSFPICVMILFLWVLTLCGAAKAEGRLRTSMPVIPGYGMAESVQKMFRISLQSSGTRASIAGISSGKTGETYEFSVDNGKDEGVMYYQFALAIMDSTHESGEADTLYDESNLARGTSPDFSYTFYLPGTYALYCYRYDANGKNVPWVFIGTSYEFIYKEVTIVDGGENALTRKVQEVAAACDQGDDYLTALAINDWLSDHVTYDNTCTYYSPDAALLQGTSVCNGYARAFAMIAEEAGLNARRVVGTAGGGGHAWDAVQMHGDWYYLDPTWNDSDDHLHHRYFGVNQEIMDYDHLMESTVGGNVECTELTDNYYIQSGTWENLAKTILPNMNEMFEDGALVFNEVSMGSRYYTEYADGGYSTSAAQKNVNGHVTAWQFSHMTWSAGETGVCFQGIFTYDLRSNTISGTLSPELQDVLTMYLPEGVQEIEANAFEGVGCEAVIVPEGCETIGSRAFSDCENLIYVQLPGSLLSVAEDAFEGSDLAAVYTMQGN